MKGRITSYDYQSNRVEMEFDADFSQTYDKYHDKEINVDIKVWRPKRSGAAKNWSGIPTGTFSSTGL